ncbi:uncharacterized protein LOC131237502 isoform X2 [Magnolia sinica]|uniref:uncharacterized protein LOC131237502 isoform X2 n=1 Tax=Magnolia sinica TaxID=86752 RepID=UPI0026597BA3|nr:uncharacterized protein LOC131237502 isoform X2 [Magnolia sinica]
MKRRTIYACGVAILSFVVLMIVTPSIPQSQEYHDFADQRQYLGIPNALNVVSNFPFLLIGVTGLILCYRNYFRLSLEGEVWGWACFFVGVAAVAFGSSYYHLKPNDARLVWDRLPMTIAFTSIMAVFIIERIDEKRGTISIVPLIMAGFYLLAKVEEAEDELIYKWTHHIVSGHTLKHLCAALVPVFLTLMLAKRSIVSERISLLQTWRISWTKVNEGRFKTESSSCEYTSVTTTEPQ